MRIDNVPHTRSVEAVHSLKPARKIDKMIDFQYKLERSEFNRQLYLYNMKLEDKKYLAKKLNNSESSFQDNLNTEHIKCTSSNINKSRSSYDITSDNVTKDKQRLCAYGRLIFQAESRKQSDKFKNHTSYVEAQNMLRRCRMEILNFNPQSFLLNASYLISPTAVIALLNFKDEDV